MEYASLRPGSAGDEEHEEVSRDQEPEAVWFLDAVWGLIKGNAREKNPSAASPLNG